MHNFIMVSYMMTYFKKQGNRKLSNCICSISWYVCNHYSLFFCLSDIHNIVTCSQHSYIFNLRASVQDFT